MAKKTGAGKRSPGASAPPPPDELNLTPVPPPLPKTNGDPEGDAKVAVSLSGTDRQVGRAAARLGASDTTVAPPLEETEPVIDEEGERIAGFMADGKNMVIVSRVFPREFAGELERYQLPLEFSQIQDDIFSRFGGETFRLSIHPNTATGAAKTLAAFTFKNSKVDWAFEEEGGGQPGAPHASGRMVPANVPAGQDPYAVPSKSPLAAVRKSLHEQTEMLAEKLQVEHAQAELDSMQEKVEERKKKKEPPQEKRITEDDLRRERERSDLQLRLDASQREMSELRNLVMAAVNKPLPAPPAQDNTLLVEIMKSSSATTAAMISSMQTSNAQMMAAITTMGRPKKEEGGLTEAIDMLTKVKGVFGNDSDKSERLNDLMYDLATERLTGKGEGGDSADEDTIRFALKQLTPVLRTYVDKKLDQQSKATGQPVSEEEKKRLYKEAAMEAAKNIALQMQKDGKLVAVPKGQKAPALPAPEGKKVPPKKPGTPTSEGVVEEVAVEPVDLSGSPPAAKPPPTPVEVVSVEKIEEPVGMEDEGTIEEENDMETPVDPGKPGYSREKAVDFVLEIAISDSGSCPPDTYLVGDIIDRLDHEMLEEFLLISTGDDLKTLFASHADPEKIKRIEELGQDEKVKSWLTRVIVTAQDEYRKMKEKTGAKSG